MPIPIRLPLKSKRHKSRHALLVVVVVVTNLLLGSINVKSTYIACEVHRMQPVYQNHRINKGDPGKNTDKIDIHL